MNKVFLNGHLNEEVYMKQPQGFINYNYPYFVYRLRKSLYGLKQAPWAWFNAIYQFSLQDGFCQSLSDASLFIYHDNGASIFFLTYVDDIIITGNQRDIINQLNYLCSCWKVYTQRPCWKVYTLDPLQSNVPLLGHLLKQSFEQ